MASSVAVATGKLEDGRAAVDEPSHVIQLTGSFCGGRSSTFRRVSASSMQLRLVDGTSDIWIWSSISGGWWLSDGPFRGGMRYNASRGCVRHDIDEAMRRRLEHMRQDMPITHERALQWHGARIRETKPGGCFVDQPYAGRDG